MVVKELKISFSDSFTYYMICTLPIWYLCIVGINLTILNEGFNVEQVNLILGSYLSCGLVASTMIGLMFALNILYRIFITKEGSNHSLEIS